MVDDIRSSVSDEQDDDDAFDAFDAASNDGRRRFLGMTAGQRAFIAVILLLNVILLAAGLLIVTGRIVL